MSENEKGGWFSRMKAGLSKSSKTYQKGWLMSWLVANRLMMSCLRKLKISYWLLILVSMPPIALYQKSHRADRAWRFDLLACFV